MTQDENVGSFDFTRIQVVTSEIALPGQMQKVRDDQVLNDAGGYSFLIDDTSRICRFLILGTSSGTYYVDAEQLTIDNVNDLIEIIKTGKGGLILHELYDVSMRGRAPKQSATMFALALCARAKYFTRDDLTGDELDKYNAYTQQLSSAALDILPKVCRIPTHLFEFLKFAKIISTETAQKKGWGRAFRNAIAKWYLQAEPKSLAIHLTKYVNREGYSHRDTLRLAHPNARKSGNKALLYDQLFNFACESKLDPKKYDENYAPVCKRPRKYPLSAEIRANAPEDHHVFVYLQNYLKLKEIPVEDANVDQVIRLVKENGFVREHIPNEFLNFASIWIAMLPDMPMTALLRNLSKLSALHIIDGSEPQNQEYVDLVVKKLTDDVAIKKARIHPLSVMLASTTYKSSKGLKGSLKWKVNQTISDALYSMFLKSFHNVEPTGKRFLLAFDISGSMDCSYIHNTVISAREASAAMGLILVHTEANVETVYFGDELTPIAFNKEWTLDETISEFQELPMNSTDCALPMQWALDQKKPFDVFIVYTDSDTYIGSIHPFDALKQYRTTMNIPDAKLIVMGMTANEFTIADPTDRNMLDIVGLDSSTPEVIRSFVLGQL